MALRAALVPAFGAQAAAAIVGLLSLAPLVFMAAIAWGAGWIELLALLARPRVAGLLLDTALLQVCVVPPALALAIGLGWLTECSDMPGRRLWSLLSIAPLAVPAFVQSYAWSSLAPASHGLPLAALVSTLAYYPLAYLPVAAQLRRLDPALEEVAAALGRRPASVFCFVLLPQLRPALAGGGLLVALHLLGEYGLFAIIGFETFTTAIVDQFQSATDSVSANMLGIVLVALCLLCLGLEARLHGQVRYARIGPGSARRAAPVRLGRWRWLSVGAVSAVAALSLGVPLTTLGRWLSYGGIPAWATPIWSALGQTAAYGLAGATSATLLAAPLAWLCVRRPSRWTRGLEAGHLYVGSLPGIIPALALVAFAVRVAPPLYQSAAMMVLAYGLIFLPRALVGLKASLAQAPVELERAAAALGRAPLAAVLAVTFRLAAPGVASAMSLVGLGIATELTATLLLAPNGTRTLATEFWSWSSELDYTHAAPYGLAMIVLSLPMTLVVHLQSRRVAGR